MAKFRDIPFKPIASLAGQAMDGSGEAQQTIAAVYALLSTVIHADTTAGVAAASEGGYFWVPAGEGVSLYQVQSGEAVEIQTLPSLEALRAGLAYASYVPDLLAAISGASISLPNVTAFNNVAALKSSTPGSSPWQGQLRGYYVANQGGGSAIEWDPLSEEEPDDIMTFAPTVVGEGPGRFKRLIEGAIDVAMAGVKENDVATADRTWPAIHTSGYRNRVLRLHAGVTRIGQIDEVDAHSLVIEGHGRGRSELAPVGLVDGTGPEGATIYFGDIPDVTFRGFTAVGGDSGLSHARYRCLFGNETKRLRFEDFAAHSPGLFRDEPTGQCVALTRCEELFYDGFYLSSVAPDAAVPDLTIGEVGWWGGREGLVMGRLCRIIRGRDGYIWRMRDTGVLVDNGEWDDEDRPQDVDLSGFVVDFRGLPAGYVSSYGFDCRVPYTLGIRAPRIIGNQQLQVGIYVHNILQSRIDDLPRYAYKVTTRDAYITGCRSAGIRAAGPAIYESHNDHVDCEHIPGSVGIESTADSSRIVDPRVERAGASAIRARNATIVRPIITDWDKPTTALSPGDPGYNADYPYDAVGLPAIGILQKGDATTIVDGGEIRCTDQIVDSETPPIRPAWALLDSPTIKHRVLEVEGLRMYGERLYYPQVDPAAFTAVVGYYRGRNLFHDKQVLPFALRVLGHDTTLDVRGSDVIELICDAPTTITNIVASPGQKFVLLGGNGNASLAGGGNIYLRQGGALNIPADGSVELVYRKTSTIDKVLEVSRAITRTVQIPAYIDDLRASTARVISVRAPVAGRVGPVGSTMGGALATDNAVIQGRRANGDDLTNLMLTLALAGSAAGVVDTANSAGANTVTAGEIIKFAVLGGNTAEVDAHLTVDFIY